MQVLLTALGLMLSFVASGIYIADIIKGNTKPHQFTYLTWTIVGMIAFIGSLASGGGSGAWIVGSSATLSAVIFLLSFKYGRSDIHWLDIVFFVGSLVAIVPWVLMKDPLWSVALAVFISFCGYCCTIRKTWRAPNTELLAAWILGCITAVLSIAALDTFNIATIAYPAQVLVMNALIVCVIMLRRNKNVPDRAIAVRVVEGQEER